MTSRASATNSTPFGPTSKSRWARDAAYIRRTIKFQRALDVAARVVIATSRSKTGWLVGTAALGFAKSVENMEIGHNVSHGQWDWMNDPEIHSSTWEWDMVAVSTQWKTSHNYRHHVFSNVLGEDDDLGFGVMRVTPEQPWQKRHLLQPLQNVFLAMTFEWVSPYTARSAPVALRVDRPGQRGAAQDRPAGRQGLSLVAGAERAAVAQDTVRQRDGESAA